MHEALDTGHLDVPLFPGAYLFRITPAAGVVPDWSPTRLLHIGGMGDGGTLFRRIGTFLGAALGMGGVGPPSSSGLKFGYYRATDGWQITVRDLDLAYCIAPPPSGATCIDASAWLWYWNQYRAGYPMLAATESYPGCDERARWACSCGSGRSHAWFASPPAP